VLEARGDSPEAQAALGELCGAYYAPVFGFIRRNSKDEEAAKDLTQAFFAKLLAGGAMDRADPQRGRFRSYLLGAVKHFLSDERDRNSRQKRGEGQIPAPLEPGTDTSPGLDPADTSTMSPEEEFDRKWALTLLDRALTGLEAEQKAAGKGEQFDVLKSWLADGEGSQAEAAGRLRMNEGAVKVAIHRLRRRFQQVVKAEIARTLHDPSLAGNELKCLLEALGGN